MKLSKFSISKIILYCCLIAALVASCRNDNYKIIGEWASSFKPNMGNLIFSKDSVYYTHYKTSFPYYISEDSMKIFFSDKTAELKYLLKNDSLFFFYDNKIDTNWRIHAKKISDD